MKPIPVAILLRVSTNKQDTQRQEHELRAVAEAKNWEVVEVCEETVSGSVYKDDRPGLVRIEELAATGRIKKVLVHEISRVARRPCVAHAFVDTLEQNKVSLYWHAHNIETLLESGKRNPAAALMLAFLAEMARAEKETLVERIKSGLEEARRKGRTLGRPKGSRVDSHTFLHKHRDIVKQLRARQSVRNAASITKKGASTVQRVKALLDVPKV